MALGTGHNQIDLYISRAQADFYEGPRFAIYLNGRLVLTDWSNTAESILAALFDDDFVVTEQGEDWEPAERLSGSYFGDA